MTGRVLLLGSDVYWCKSLENDLPLQGLEGVAAHSLDKAIKKAGAAPFVAAVIAAYGNRQTDGAGAALSHAEALRKKFPGLPLLFNISVADYALTTFVLNEPPARLTPSEQSDEIAAAVAALLRRLARPAPTTPPRFAALEIGVSIASISFTARLDNDADPFGPFPVPSNQNSRLRDINDSYRTFRLYTRDLPSGRALTPGWSDKLRDTGKELGTLFGLDGGAQTAVLAAFVGKLRRMEHIHIRFNLPRDSMEHVPFELVWDHGRSSHLRELAPVARRLMLENRHRIAAPLPASQAALQGPVLFIQSSAHGSLSIDGVTFGSKTTLNFQKLNHLATELSDLRRVRKDAGLAAPGEVEWSADEDKQAELVLAKVKSRTWDVVHFAGHSVRDDANQVHLLLPGIGRPVPLRVQSFAKAALEGGVRLVVLSSCESASPDAVFRLAQAGIPAVIGFRWEVDDEEAASFTAAFHTALAAGNSVGRAFYAAVSGLYGRPTFASPVLMVQDEDWAEPTTDLAGKAKHVADSDAVGPG